MYGSWQASVVRRDQWCKDAKRTMRRRWVRRDTRPKASSEAGQSTAKEGNKVGMRLRRVWGTSGTVSMWHRYKVSRVWQSVVVQKWRVWCGRIVVLQM